MDTGAGLIVLLKSLNGLYMLDDGHACLSKTHDNVAMLTSPSELDNARLWHKRQVFCTRQGGFKQKTLMA